MLVLSCFVEFEHVVCFGGLQFYLYVPLPPSLVWSSYYRGYILYTQAIYSILKFKCRKLNEKYIYMFLLKSLCSFFHYILFNKHNMTILITSQAHFFFPFAISDDTCKPECPGKNYLSLVFPLVSILPLIPALPTQSFIFLTEPFAFLVIHLCLRERASSLGRCVIFLETTQCAFLCDDGGQMWFFQWVLFCLFIYVFFRLWSAVWNKINQVTHFS